MPESDSEEEDRAGIWALLVAGSKGWEDYRHQANVCHAYHVLRDHGIPENRIVTMMFDDIARNRQNPFPGRIFNSPVGKDVYGGVRIDYRGKDVTAENFLAILQGNASAVTGGNGRVIESNETDNIFVFFSDHGATGFISFPSSILTVKDLNNALIMMHKRRRYKQLVFYLEACSSGSMFNKVLPKNIDIYAVTSANDHENSWACYCENDMGLPCLGGEFSVSWMEHSDEEDLSLETLEMQYEYVKRINISSHVMQYGDLSVADEYVAHFQGWESGPAEHDFRNSHDSSSTWDPDDVMLNMLKNRLAKEDEPLRRRNLERVIKKIEKKRAYLELFFSDIVERLVDDPISQLNVLSDERSAITQLQCHDEVLKVFHRHCFNFEENPYALKYAYVLANLCEEGIDSEVIVGHLLKSCSDLEISGIY